MKTYVRSRAGKTKRKRSDEDTGEENTGERRGVRSKYLKISNLINDKRDDISGVDVESSHKFRSIMSEVEQLHQSVSKPREQVADAETLLNLTDIIVNSVKSHSNDGITPSEFISCLLRDYATTSVSRRTGATRSYVHWHQLGFDVSPIFMRFNGCSTMVGPMDKQLKQRKAPVRKPRTKRSRPPTSCPKEIDGLAEEDKTDTDKNLVTMFEILKKKRRVGLECLILNRKCFAQTVENLFALSFLVKDGRVEITIDANGCHIVSPRNAPTARSVQSGRVDYKHFVFRCDFKDWQLMLDYVPVGEELMPHRQYSDIDSPCSLETPPQNRSRAFSENQSRPQKSSSGRTRPERSNVAKCSARECNTNEDSVDEIVQEKSCDVNRGEESALRNVWKDFRFQKVFRKREKNR